MKRKKLEDYIQIRLERVVGKKLEGVDGMIHQLADLALQICPTALVRCPSVVGGIAVRHIVSWQGGDEIPDEVLESFCDHVAGRERLLIEAGRGLSRLEGAYYLVRRYV